MSNQVSSTFRQKPATRLGWWAVGLAGFFVFMLILTSVGMMIGSKLAEPRNVIPNSGFLQLLVALASGIVALIAIIRNRERSWLVWLALIPGILGVLTLLGEFLLPH